MKNTVLLTLSAFVLAFFVACGGGNSNAVEANEAGEAAEAAPTGKEYNVDLAKSTVEWTGTKITNASHTGGISLTSGSVAVDGETLIKGSFELDMNSITNADITDEESNQMLVGHLKSGDFFDVEKHPNATFVVTKVAAIEGAQTGQPTHNVSGNLTIKGMTKEITIPATVGIEENQVAIIATFTIDRTDWDIKYGSGKFFDVKELGDKLIKDDIGFRVKLVATPAAA